MARHEMALAAGVLAFSSGLLSLTLVPRFIDSRVVVGVVSAIVIGLCVGIGLSVGQRLRDDW
jgi:hypothetical protein